MAIKKTGYTVDTAFMLMLFLIFSLTVLSVLISGAGVYKSTKALMQERFEERTCLSYITTKLNSNAKASSVYVSDFDGVKALCFTERLGKLDTITRLYYYDGFVRELTTSKDSLLKPENGEEIVRAKALDFKADGDLLTVSCTGRSGENSRVCIFVETGLGAEK